MNRGKIVIEGKPEELKNMAGERVILITSVPGKLPGDKEQSRVAQSGRIVQHERKGVKSFPEWWAASLGCPSDLRICRREYKERGILHTKPGGLIHSGRGGGMALIAGSVIRKDLKVYIRHRKTLVLIFIAPVLIMVMIGSVFSGASGEGFTDIKLGVGGGSAQGEQIIKELRSNRMFIIIQENTTDPSVIEEGVRRGKYSAGILILHDETGALRLYVDNSRMQIAPGILSAFLSTTEKLSYELTFGFISKLWKNLAQMESELWPLKEGILQINGSMSGLNRDTSHVLVSLDEINVTALNGSIAGMKSTLDIMRSDLHRTSDYINSTRRELKELDSNVTSIYNDSVALRDDLRFVIDSIDSADAALLSIQTDLQNTSSITCADPTTPQCVSLANAIKQIQDTRAQMLERSSASGRFTIILRT